MSLESETKLCAVMNFSVRDKFAENVSPWTCGVCRTLIISTISSVPPPPPRADIFFLPFLSPSAPVCFYSCKMLVALLKYCSALSALFFLLPTPLPLVFFPFVTPTHHHHNSAPPSTPAQPPHLSCCCRGQRWWGGRVRQRGEGPVAESTGAQ